MKICTIHSRIVIQSGPKKGISWQKNYWEMDGNTINRVYGHEHTLVVGALMECMFATIHTTLYSVHIYNPILILWYELKWHWFSLIDLVHLKIWFKTSASAMHVLRTRASEGIGLLGGDFLCKKMFIPCKRTLVSESKILVPDLSFWVPLGFRLVCTVECRLCAMEGEWTNQVWFKRRKAANGYSWKTRDASYLELWTLFS